MGAGQTGTEPEVGVAAALMENRPDGAGPHSGIAARNSGIKTPH
jgi:hypothetical protein